MLNTSLIYSDSSLDIGLYNYTCGKSNMPEHFHTFLTISLVLRGELWERKGNEVHRAGPGSVSIKPAHIWHSDAFIQDCTILSLRIHDWEYYDLNFQEWQWKSTPGTIRHFLEVAMDPGKKDKWNKLANHLSAPEGLSSIPRWLLDVKKVLDRDFRENLKVSELAGMVGRHPVHLTRMFKRKFGVDIKTYQRNQRIHYAMSEAFSNPGKLGDLAYDCGFADQSHFSREFKKVTSLSPRQLISHLNV